MLKFTILLRNEMLGASTTSLQYLAKPDNSITTKCDKTAGDLITDCKPDNYKNINSKQRKLKML